MSAAADADLPASPPPESIAQAELFADGKPVRFVKKEQSQTWLSEWDFMGGDNVYIRVDAATNLVSHVTIHQPSSEDAEAYGGDASTAEGIARSWLAEHNVDINGYGLDSVVSRRTLTKGNSDNVYAFTFTWTKTTDTGVLLPCYTAVTIGVDGKARGFSRIDRPLEISISPDVSPDDSLAVAMKQANMADPTVTLQRLFVWWDYSGKQTLHWEVDVRGCAQGPDGATVVRDHLVRVNAMTGSVIDDLQSGASAVDGKACAYIPGTLWAAARSKDLIRSATEIDIVAPAKRHMFLGVTGPTAPALGVRKRLVRGRDDVEIDRLVGLIGGALGSPRGPRETIAASAWLRFTSGGQVYWARYGGGALDFALDSGEWTKPTVSAPVAGSLKSALDELMR